ncbi:uncharacterized protein LOC132715404 [Ruditapes philippinarum]|uniref:uncharacterized protein LOC132715404 n=1 Tax=Ruditapes philippinarum TaxID=129788 RepID=UPI00295C04BB|nr:uncharacterized protein LOC132715404 [Ruditapes philippinarum]
MLVQKINELLREVNSAPEPKTINEGHVRERVQRYIQAKKLCSNDEELTLAVMELMIDIFKQSDTTILPAEKCCIRFVIRCKSYTGLLELLEYLDSNTFDQRIQDITTALRKQTEISIFLTVVVSADSLQQIKKNLIQNQMATESCKPRSRTVNLPVRSRNIRSIEHVWKLFQEGDINPHLFNISRILSTIVGDDIGITSSINLKKLKQSLQNIESNTAHTSHDESKTVTLKENLDEVFPCSISDRDVVNEQAHADVPFIRRRQRQERKSRSTDDRSLFSAQKHRYKETAEKQYGDPDEKVPYLSYIKMISFTTKQRLRSLEHRTYNRESDKSSPRGSFYHAISRKEKLQEQGICADSNVPILDIEGDDAMTQRLERLRVARAKILEQRQSDEVILQSCKDCDEKSRSESTSSVSLQKSDRDKVHTHEPVSM